MWGSETGTREQRACWELAWRRGGGAGMKGNAQKTGITESPHTPSQSPFIALGCQEFGSPPGSVGVPECIAALSERCTTSSPAATGAAVLSLRSPTDSC
ncbi:hypothetical protein SKAU_G00300600 [Synaphobranchus kaupii]|uniref:Uncharacterized protein n=1 Tax=Synaphobranchus kaupii TaxID=118154 RepID=A0A9Q1IM97_SYNKA|nr:hypothetical protein SKAU_G00300600 [Synaphobranchus kaupii]